MTNTKNLFVVNFHFEIEWRCRLIAGLRCLVAVSEIRARTYYAMIIALHWLIRVHGVWVSESVLNANALAAFLSECNNIGSVISTQVSQLRGPIPSESPLQRVISHTCTGTHTFRSAIYISLPFIFSFPSIVCVRRVGDVFYFRFWMGGWCGVTPIFDIQAGCVLQITPEGWWLQRGKTFPNTHQSSALKIGTHIQ